MINWVGMGWRKWWRTNSYSDRWRDIQYWRFGPIRIEKWVDKENYDV